MGWLGSLRFKIHSEGSPWLPLAPRWAPRSSEWSPCFGAPRGTLGAPWGPFSLGLLLAPPGSTLWSPLCNLLKPYQA